MYRFLTVPWRTVANERGEGRGERYREIDLITEPITIIAREDVLFFVVDFAR